MIRRSHTLAALVAFSTVVVGAAVVLPATAASADTPGTVVITEFEYQDALEAADVSGAKYEFFELTNTGGASVDLTGWSFSDSHRATSGSDNLSLTGLGTVEPGQSVVVTEASSTAFRDKWGLADSIVVLGGENIGLGNGDEINIYDASGTTVDSLVYGTSPRTRGTTGVPISAAALGANDISQWQLSTLTNDPKSWAAPNGGDLGSPGTSQFGSGLDPRAGDTGGGSDPGGSTFTPDPNWANIKINEVSSDNDPAPVRDTVELTNTGDTAVDITGWLQGDSGGPSSATDFSGRVHLLDGTLTTSVPAHGFVWFQSLPGLSSSGDAVHVYLPDGAAGAAGTEVDGVSFGAGGAGTEDPASFGAAALARCPDGTGVFASVAARSFAESNAAACEHQVVNPNEPAPNDLPAPCAPEGPSLSDRYLPASPLPWPGSAVVTTADNQCYFETATGPEGRDISSLVFSRTEPGVLWAVKNKNWLFKLVKQDGVYVAAPGWTGGKEIFFPGGTGQPDSEGITEGPTGLLYVTTERNNAANDIALNSILRLDPSTAGSTLTATKQWDLTSEFPWLSTGSSTEANLGFEGVTYVPDSYLTANGFVDQRTGATYKPANYPGHGDGLFFAALEDDGNLYAYALYENGSFTRIAVVPTGLPMVQDVQYDPDLRRIWALCDNDCAVTSTLLKIDSTGTIVPEKVYSRPAGLPDNNVEGFAVAPVSTSADGQTREVVWSDDGIYGTGVGSSTEGHALYLGALNVDLGLGGQGATPPVWSKTKVYGAGDRVSYNGKTYQALWYTSGETPGSGAYGAWAEYATDAAGNTLWTPTWVFNAGDVVLYDGLTWVAQWYSRGEVPGSSPYTSWKIVVDNAHPAAWVANSVYQSGDKVIYQGHTYQAQWYTANQVPTTPYGPWKLVA